MLRAATRAPGRPRRSRTGELLAAVAVLAVALAACGGAPAPTPASAAPDFPLVAYQGGEVLGGREATFAAVFRQGRPVVLNFWAGRCPPCQAEMPAFQRVADEYAGQVIFVGVDVGSFTSLGTHDDARFLLRDLGIRYPAAYAVDASPLRLYHVVNMPTTIFLSPEGRIVQRVGGVLTEAQLRDGVQQLVATPR